MYKKPKWRRVLNAQDDKSHSISLGGSTPHSITEQSKGGRRHLSAGRTACRGSSRVQV